MTALNQLIAASGQKLYENVRKGWTERPEEARQRGLEELKLSGMGQEQELRGLQIESERAVMEEQAAGADVRALKLEDERRKAQPEYIAKQEAAAAEKGQADLDAVRQGLAASKSNVTRLESKEEREAAAAKRIDYSNIVIGAVSQASTQDAVSYLATNKEALLKAGSPTEDATIEAILSAPPEEQDRLVKMLRAAQPDIIAHQREMEKSSGKAAAKAKAKGAGKLTPKLLTNDEVETKMEVLLNKDPRIEGSGQFGELSSDETAEFKTDVISLAKQLMEVVAKGGVMLDHSKALEDAYERVSQLVIKNPDTMSTNAYTYKRLKK